MHHQNVHYKIKNIFVFSFYFRCKKHDVPIEKIFNKTQRDKFRWAIEMADENYSFIKMDK